MAVTITRTNWQDDDGSGTVGTVINNAAKTDLYNQIDAALAKVAQLAGGNTFSGTQIVTPGPLQINSSVNLGTAKLMIAGDGTANTGISIQNLNASPSMGFMLFYNSAAAIAGQIAQSGATSVSFVTTSDHRLKVDAGRATDLSSLRAVVVHDFTWRADGVSDRGVFAQEAHALYPRAIVAGTDETTERGDLARPWMTDYSKFVPDLIVGWQQHDAELTALRAALSGAGSAG
jgi:hypothetical protein